MSTTIYPIYRFVSRPIQFKGLKGQYILIAAAALIGDLLFFILLYCCRVPAWICVSVVLGLGAIAITTCYRFSGRYGVYGLQKIRASRRIPSCIRCRTRKLFTHLNT